MEYNFDDIRSINPSVYAIAPFSAIRQKSAYRVNISEYPGPNLTYFTGLVGVLVGMVI